MYSLLWFGVLMLVRMVFDSLFNIVSDSCRIYVGCFSMAIYIIITRFRYKLDACLRYSLYKFGIHCSEDVVEGAPQARPKTTGHARKFCDHLGKSGAYESLRAGVEVWR